MIDWALAWSVVLTGIVVVFLALVLLVIVVTLFGKISENVEKKAHKSKEEAQKPAPVEVAKVVEETSAVVVEDVDGIPEEVVAAITAAITCVMEAEGNDSKSFTVKSIKKVKEARPAWAMAGLVENTRAF